MFQIGEYRGFIAGVLAVLCVYALISCWPALQALMPGRGPAPVARTPSSVAESPGGAPAPPTPAPSGTGWQEAGDGARATGSPQPERVQSLYLSTEVPPEDSRRDSEWKMARVDLVLLEKPGGLGLRPPSLCRAALMVCRGAHVRVLGERDGWVKVQSPSRAVGWVKAAEMRVGE
jgi:hypothetical protein